MRLEALSQEQCEVVRQWRNEDISHLRTPYLLTAPMQEQFFYDVVSHRKSVHRYWAVMDKVFLAIGGITNIQWENRIGEISLLIAPKLRMQGYGPQIVDLLLSDAFNRLNLQTVHGECYWNNEKGIVFWGKIVNKYNGFEIPLPKRKFWNGQYYNGQYFSIDANDFRKVGK